MSVQWITLIGATICVFFLKYLGHSLPESWLSHPRIQRINNLIPIVLLSALVAIQAVTVKTKLVIDHRSAGLAVAVLAFSLKRSFTFAVLSAAATSAAIYHWA